MEDADGVAVFGEDFGEAFVAVRGFVEACAAELDSGARSARAWLKSLSLAGLQPAQARVPMLPRRPASESGPATPAKAAKGQLPSDVRGEQKLADTKAQQVAPLQSGAAPPYTH